MGEGLQNVQATVASLRTAEAALTEASVRARYEEDGRTNLNGPVTHIIGGLVDAVGALADELAERAPSTSGVPPMPSRSLAEWANVGGPAPSSSSQEETPE